MASTNGSQFFFWLTEASVEITPKLISEGVCAPAAATQIASANAPNAACLNDNNDRIVDFSCSDHPGS